jgi:hypothetical protein
VVGADRHAKGAGRIEERVKAHSQAVISSGQAPVAALWTNCRRPPLSSRKRAPNGVAAGHTIARVGWLPEGLVILLIVQGAMKHAVDGLVANGSGDASVRAEPRDDAAPPTGVCPASNRGKPHGGSERGPRSHSVSNRQANCAAPCLWYGR